MRKIFVGLFLVTGNYCLAQTTGQVNVPVTAPLPQMQTYQWVSRPEEDGTDLQKKFVKQEWTPGTVKFRSSRPVMQVPLLFDVHNDNLFYLMGDLIMEFVDSVSQFHIDVPYKGDTLTMFYRRFYPAIQANTGSTFYQVLVEGKISLLKCQSKSILLFKDPLTAEERKKDPPKQLYFAFLRDNRIVQIDLSAEKLLTALPEYANEINNALKKEKKPKDEERMINFFVHLNNEIKQ